MDEEVRESPTIKFDARKHSLNEPIHGKTTFANSSKSLVSIHENNNFYIHVLAKDIKCFIFKSK